MPQTPNRTGGSAMSEAELDLLAALDAILTEGSVTAAAGRLGISVPAMSRHLKRAREVFGDPLMVRSGNGLVPTPRCLALRGRVHQIVADARSGIRESSLTTCRKQLRLTQLVIQEPM